MRAMCECWCKATRFAALAFTHRFPFAGYVTACRLVALHLVDYVFDPHKPQLISKIVIQSRHSGCDPLHPSVIKPWPLKDPRCTSCFEKQNCLLCRLIHVGNQTHMPCIFLWWIKVLHLKGKGCFVLYNDFCRLVFEEYSWLPVWQFCPPVL